MNRAALLLIPNLTACGPVRDGTTAGAPCQDAASVNLARSVRAPYDSERFGALPVGGESERFRVTLREQGTVVGRYSFTCRESASGSVELTWTPLP